MAVKTRAPTEPTDTRAEPPVDGADVVAGGAAALDEELAAEELLAGTLALEVVKVVIGRDADALMVGAGALVSGTEVTGDEAGGEASEVG